MNIFLKRQMAFALVLGATCPLVVSAAESADTPGKARSTRSTTVDMTAEYESPTPIYKFNTVIVTPSVPSRPSSVERLLITVELGFQTFYLEYASDIDAKSWTMYNEIRYDGNSTFSKKVKVNPGAPIEVNMEKRQHLDFT